MNTSDKQKQIKKRHKQNNRPFRRHAIRWHRRIGLLSALVVLFLSSSGIALNHIDRLYKQTAFNPSVHVSSNFILDWYGIKQASNVVGYSFDLSERAERINKPSDIIWADGTIIVLGQPLFFNEKPLIGVCFYQDIYYIFTKNSVHLISSQAERIESQHFTHYNFDAVLLSSEKSLVVMQVIRGGRSSDMYFDLDEMTFQKAQKPTLTKQTNLSDFLIVNKNDANFARQFSLSKSKVLSDLHSGRFFGQYGHLVMDAFAILFILLALSGVFMWAKQNKSKRN